MVFSWHCRISSMYACIHTHGELFFDFHAELPFEDLIVNCHGLLGTPCLSKLAIYVANWLSPLHVL